MLIFCKFEGEIEKLKTFLNWTFSVFSYILCVEGHGRLTELWQGSDEIYDTRNVH